VLYEMLTGQRAFRHETAAETMTAILREDPPELSASRADVPPALDRIVRHSLEKNPAERFQTARDVAFALEAFSGTAISSTSMPALPASARWLRLAIIAVAFTIAGLTAGFGLTTWLRPAAAETAIGFETRTLDPQWITNIRFAPGGETIVYSAAASGNVPSLFVLRQGAVVPQPLGEVGTHLLSVSRSGELAVLTGVRYIDHRLFVGTLARMTMDGGSRPLMDGVREADWSSDGTTMAVVRDLGTKDRLEFPVDTKLYEADGYLSDPRVSPDGSRIAFLEHSLRYDDRGSLKVVDRRGVVKTLAGPFSATQGVAWSPDGRTVFVSTTAQQTIGYLTQAVNVDGDPVRRRAFPSMTSTVVMDVAPDGRLLVSADEFRTSIRVLLPGESVERELPWLEVPIPRDLSADGKWLLFDDQSAGLNYAVAWRKTDGSPAVRLGEGSAVALSPDGRWAIGFISSPTLHYVAYPTGPGQPTRLDFSPVENVDDVSFFPDGRILFCGTESNKPPRCYRKDLTGGTPAPVTPEHVARGWPAPDGRTILVATTSGAWQVVDVAGGPPRNVAGDHAIDRMVGWSRDSRAIFAVAGRVVPARIDRIDLSTGVRTRVREVMPPDRLGVVQIFIRKVFHDAESYIYGYTRQTSRAVVVSGVNGR
jgi:DNA-binding beta-propeller fold protein YncE